MPVSKEQKFPVPKLQKLPVPKVQSMLVPNMPASRVQNVNFKNAEPVNPMSPIIASLKSTMYDGIVSTNSFRPLRSM